MSFSEKCYSPKHSFSLQQPRSPTQILMELAEEEKEDLDKSIADLEDENRYSASFHFTWTNLKSV